MYMKSTVAAKVYGLILTHPGITSREINRMLWREGIEHTTHAVQSALHSFRRRGAIIATEGDTNRNMRYYKGSAPVALKQPVGGNQQEIEVASSEWAKLQLARQIKQEIKDSLAAIENKQARIRELLNGKYEELLND